MLCWPQLQPVHAITLDINECTNGEAACHPQARCINVPGIYYCKCHDGYFGDGEENCVKGELIGFIAVSIYFVAVSCQ